MIVSIAGTLHIPDEIKVCAFHMGGVANVSHLKKSEESNGDIIHQYFRKIEKAIFFTGVIQV